MEDKLPGQSRKIAASDWKENLRSLLAILPGQQAGYSDEADMSETVKQALTPDLEAVLGEYMNVLRSEARSHGIHVINTTVDNTFDHEIGLPVIIVTQYVADLASAAMEYWDKAALAIAEWRSALPDKLKRIAYQQLVFEVRWS